MAGVLISGATGLVAMVGSPIAQVKSPGHFNRWFAERGLDLAMIPVNLQAEALPAFITTLRGWHNLQGCVVTVPYKQVVAGLLDHLSERAALLGSVNVIRREADGRLLGDNVDGAGFLKAARAHGFEAAGRCAVVIGAGGAGSAIAYALCEGGIRQLVLTDVDTARAAALAMRLGQAFPKVELLATYESLAGVDLLVNASTVGMGNTNELPLPAGCLDTLEAQILVADVVTSPVLTPLLRRAQALGARVQTGAEMARAQMGDLGSFMQVMPAE
jgi:shikimate dehydrogenase